MNDLAEARLAHNTLQAYRGALDRLDAWLAGRGLDDTSLSEYLTALFEAGRSPSTAAIAVAAVRWRSRTEGLPSPVGDQAAATLAGYRRRGSGRGWGQVRGLTWAEVEAIADQAEAEGGLAGIRDAAIVTLASDCLLRVSELSALDVADVAHDPRGGGLLHVRRSKTDQEGRGRTLFVGAGTLDRLDIWLTRARVRLGPLFRAVRGDQVQGDRLRPRAFRRVLASRAAAAGIAGRISGHSPRVGSAQDLARAGASVAELMQAGRWKDPQMVGRYTAGELAARGAIARFKYGGPE